LTSNSFRAPPPASVHSVCLVGAGRRGLSPHSSVTRNAKERGRQLRRPRSLRQTESRANYCSALATLLNVPFTAVPVACTATMIATAIPAAIRPYSIAVAPELSFKKRRTSLCILESPVLLSKFSTCTRKSYTRQIYPSI